MLQESGLNVIEPGAGRRLGDEETAAVIGILRQRFGERLQTGEAIRREHSHTTTYLAAQLPDAVVVAQTTEEVAETVRICGEYGMPVIPFGTGTSLEGGVNAPFGGISIDLRTMDRVLAVHAEDLDCTVQAGCTREALNSHLRDTGLFFPIDPGANASLGGMAATRASGTNAVRYGTMRDNVVNVTAVMADGSVVHTAQRAKKSSAGYDLTRLLVGSEGTLGIITELTVRLWGIPERIAAGVCQFPDVDAACRTTISVIQAAIPIARIELLDALQMEMVNRYAKLAYANRPTLFVEFHGSPAGVEEQTAFFQAIAEDHGGTAIEWAEKSEDRNRLWKARHNAYHAVTAWRPGAKAVATDACVPISRLAECVGETQADIERLGLTAPIVGHVGDGNFHVSPLVMMEDEDEVGRMETMVARLARRAIAMGGTCTGEHGIGQGKMKYMAEEHGNGLAVMRAIKKALDPADIMNPGKVVPD
ncbi:MAG: FAD-binding protein [Nitratireductor sp.]|nr:FAD-binding protein [Nitratireductor sp.]